MSKKGETPKEYRDRVTDEKNEDLKKLFGLKKKEEEVDEHAGKTSITPEEYGQLSPTQKKRWKTINFWGTTRTPDKPEEKSLQDKLNAWEEAGLGVTVACPQCKHENDPKSSGYATRTKDLCDKHLDEWNRYRPDDQRFVRDTKDDSAELSPAGKEYYLNKLLGLKRKQY